MNAGAEHPRGVDEPRLRCGKARLARMIGDGVGRYAVRFEPSNDRTRSSRFVRRQAHDSGRLSRVPGSWCWQPRSECCASRCPQSGHVMIFDVERTGLPRAAMGFFICPRC
jgi:hypothetical protein